LIGLLYATGLRISEALKLTLGDLDLKRRLLLVRETKFKKTRYVPISYSTVQQLRNYLCKRTKAGYSTNRSMTLFVNNNSRPYDAAGISHNILAVQRSLGIRGPKGQKGPRVHDFRHTFAVNRLATWYKQGVDISAKLPLLATYLGHITLIGTETYLQATAELLQKASNRFYKQFMLPEHGIRKVVSSDKSR
jgi:integrase